MFQNLNQVKIEMLKNSETYTYITYLYYPLGYFLPSSISVKNYGKIKISNFLNLTPSVL